MIIKEREVPISIQKLDALSSRILKSHPQKEKINDDLSKRVAGFRGEQSINYYLKFLSIPDHSILHNLRLLNNNLFFQLDTLLISPRFFLIIEMKNMSGELYLDQKYNQLIRTVNGKTDVFPDPLLQVKRQKIQLQNYLNKNGFENIPIETLVVFTNPYALIKTDGNNADYIEKVIHSANLPTVIEQFHNSNKNQLLSTKQIMKISNMLLKENQVYNPDILKMYDIPVTDLLTGIHCPKCSKLAMKRDLGKWVCPFCSYSSKFAHLASLHDYSLLISPTITNKQLRYFLQLPSRSVSSKILVSMKLSHSGKTRSRLYRLNENDLIKFKNLEKFY